MKLQTEFPSDYTRLACTADDCDWYGDITELVVVELNAETDSPMVLICPKCAEIIFEQFDPVLHSPKPTNGDKHDGIQNKGHQAQPVS